MCGDQKFMSCGAKHLLHDPVLSLEVLKVHSELKLDVGARVGSK